MADVLEHQGVDAQVVSAVLRGDAHARRVLVERFEPVFHGLFTQEMGLSEWDAACLRRQVWPRLAEGEYRVLREWTGTPGLEGYLKAWALRVALDCLENNEEARSRFGERLSRDVRRIVARLLGRAPDDDQVQEISQDVLFDLWRCGCGRLRRWRGTARLSTFLHTVATRLALTHLQRQGHPAAEVPWDGLLDPADPGPGPEEEAFRSELRVLVRQAIEGLDPRDQQPIMLKYFENLSAREIAQRMTATAGNPGSPMTENHVNVRLHHLRHRLARELRRRHPDLFGGPRD